MDVKADQLRKTHSLLYVPDVLFQSNTTTLPALLVVITDIRVAAPYSLALTGKGFSCNTTDDHQVTIVCTFVYLLALFTFLRFQYYFCKSIILKIRNSICHMDRVKRIWYLSPMRAAKVQASLRIRAVSPEPSLLAHTSSESRGSFRQKARSLAPLNGWACAVKICHDEMLEDTNSLDGAHIL